MISEIQFRNATFDDADLLYNWANDETVRSNSFTHEKILYEDHLKWFQEKLCNPNCFIFIATYDVQPVGLLRLDIEANKARISYSIDKLFRGKGFGYKIIANVENLICKFHIPVNEIIAEVAKNNIPSLKIFRKAHYVEEAQSSKSVFVKDLNKLI